MQWRLETVVVVSVVVRDCSGSGALLVVAPGSHYWSQFLEI